MTHGVRTFACARVNTVQHLAVTTKRPLTSPRSVRGAMDVYPFAAQAAKVLGVLLIGSRSTLILLSLAVFLNECFDKAFVATTIAMQFQAFAQLGC